MCLSFCCWFSGLPCYIAGLMSILHYLAVYWFGFGCVVLAFFSGSVRLWGLVRLLALSFWATVEQRYKAVKVSR